MFRRNFLMIHRIGSRTSSPSLWYNMWNAQYKPCPHVASCDSNLSEKPPHVQSDPAPSKSCHTLVWDDPKLLDDGGEIPKSQGGGWRSNFWLWNLLFTWLKTCQVVNCLMCFDVGMSAFCLKKQKKQKNVAILTKSQWMGRTGHCLHMNRLKFKKITHHFRGIKIICLKSIRKTERCHHVTSWTWKH